jgi:hypothetical protein
VGQDGRMRGHPPDARATTGSRPSCWSSWSTLARDGDHRPHGRRRAPGQSHPHADYCGWPAGAREASMALIPKRASASRHRCHSDPAILRYAPQRHFKASARPELSFSGDPYCGASLNRRVGTQESDGRHLRRLLRARRERPRRRRAAEQRDELAAPCMTRKKHCES